MDTNRGSRLQCQASVKQAGREQLTNTLKALSHDAVNLSKEQQQQQQHQ
jgi:hypothetical protein